MERLIGRDFSTVSHQRYCQLGCDVAQASSLGLDLERHEVCDVQQPLEVTVALHALEAAHQLEEDLLERLHSTLTWGVKGQHLVCQPLVQLKGGGGTRHGVLLEYTNSPFEVAMSDQSFGVLSSVLGQCVTPFPLCTLHAALPVALLGQEVQVRG